MKSDFSMNLMFPQIKLSFENRFIHFFFFFSFSRSSMAWMSLSTWQVDRGDFESWLSSDRFSGGHGLYDTLKFFCFLFSWEGSVVERALS